MMDNFKDIPVYQPSAAYAKAHGEMEQYRASHRANAACTNAIEQTIAHHYRNNRLDAAAVQEVAAQFGMERMQYVLAVNVREKSWDGRMSAENIAWAKTVPVLPDLDDYGTDRRIFYVAHRTHPGVLNLFVGQARKLVQEQKRSVQPQLNPPNLRKKKSPMHQEPER